MPTKKKKASSKKGSSKKSSATSKSAATISVLGGIPKLKLDFPLNAQKVAAIQRCVAKGKLTVTVSRVDLALGRLGDAWLYD
jgi:anti-sigma28 factor (negative regulator of flagellin synthesis)